MQGESMYKVAIVGSGPAGHTAAVYAARANLQPVMVEGLVRGGVAGGQLMITTDVENYPGFPDGIKGPELMDLFKRQSQRFGTEIISSDVEKVDLSSRPFKLWTSEEQELTAESLIIATGASARWLGLPNEEALQNRGVSACATCDGYFFRDQHVAVVGGGDTAMEEANYLAGLCSRVTVIHRRDALRASKIMAQRALDNPKIDFVWDSVVTDVKDVSAGKVTAVEVENRKTGKRQDLAVEGLFIAIGHQPNTDIFKGQLELDGNGYIVTQPGSTRTSIEGVFAAGDVQDHVYRQAVTAAGTGCMAAIEAERWLAGM
ncbi:MAG: thioredoxin-disulfide reductase [Myxococcales bacterium]|nr:thioredoxin-disulfide reductase [Myxococcales bacterium]MDD9966624.1 thioredoxin-disulfide reductase [Myxococcales bacterium]